MADRRYLFDSNILIYLIQGESAELRARVEALAPGEAVTSSICVAEVLFGLKDADGAIMETFEALLELVKPLPFDVSAARAFPDVPFRRGRSDRLIAAHALALEVTLVTNNERDFADVPNIRVENWTCPL